MYFDVSIWVAYTYVNSNTISLKFDQIMGEVCYAFVILTDIIVYHEAAFKANFNNATLAYGYTGNYVSNYSLSGSKTFTPYTASATIDQTAFFYGLRHVNKMGTGSSALNYTFTVSGTTLSLSIYNSHQ